LTNSCGLVVWPAKTAAQAFETADVSHRINHSSEHKFVGPPKFGLRSSGKRGSKGLNQGAGDRIKHLADYASPLRIAVHRLMRQQAAEAGIPVVRPEMEHGKDKGLDDQLQPSVQVGLAHRDREARQALLDDDGRPPLEHRAI
jgi:hypothetical protein